MKKQTDILLVGGGSGGHITPLVSVAEALKEINKDRLLVHIGHKNDPLNDITRGAGVIDAVYEVSAGKFRRYHTQSVITKLFDVKTNLLNIRDFFRFLYGTLQAWRLLGQLKPRVIFMKGGYVCANVGFAARLRKIPYITHDSDAMVSLAHRMIAKGALEHLTALPPAYYKTYDTSKTRQVGVPVAAAFKPVKEADKTAAKKQLGIDDKMQVLLITGGGLGAHNINQGVLYGVEQLMSQSSVYAIHLTGAKNYKAVLAVYRQMPDSVRRNVLVEPFTNRMSVYSAAADVIVTRASMTAVTEFGVQGKACILVPNPLLAGGHQLKNAAALKAERAVHSIAEEDFRADFVDETRTLLEDEAERTRLGLALYSAVIPDASAQIALILEEVIRK